ncbi:hypothetical protein CSQ85_02205 [Bifidobacterium rousetti]|uniref:TraX family protein n=1 Tax=Bifidobacterium rousetti TaxID=2045439 RepID=UPI00123A73EA|nr:TraX family protein [Bifidobacterium rousetti]KAA8820613.1 hypothetical protein CSQ85_02205 [Bifidobacterium rousetti]
MSSFALKVIACVFMFIDHMAQFLPGMPAWMHWIGRLSAPIFLFLIGWSCVYTSNRKRFLLRLYLASVGMSIIQATSYIFARPDAQPIDNNIFATLFQTSLIICLLSAPTAHERLHNMSIYVAVQVALSTGVYCTALFLDNSSYDASSALYVLQAASGTVLGLEGGLLTVATGVILWATRSGKRCMSLAYISMSLIQLAMTTSIPGRMIGRIADTGPGSEPVLSVITFTLNVIGIPELTLGQSPITVNIQWMMVFALPFMLLYNHQRGPQVRWFFYVFYPVHIVVLYLIGMAMSNPMPG